MSVIWNILISAVTGSAAAVGFARWLGGLWADNILERQKQEYRKELESIKINYERELRILQAEIENSVFVNRAQFDTEFSAYKDAFAELSDVRLAFESVRPIFAIEPAHESEDAKLQRLGSHLNELAVSYRKALGIIGNLQPFYPDEIYQHMMECVKWANIEIANVQTSYHRRFSVEWFEDGAKRRDKFISAYNAVADLIRTRIGQLSIRPSRAL